MVADSEQIIAMALLFTYHNTTIILGGVLERPCVSVGLNLPLWELQLLLVKRFWVVEFCQSLVASVADWDYLSSVYV